MRHINNSVLIFLITLLNSCSEFKENNFEVTSNLDDHQFRLSNEKIDSIIGEYIQKHNVKSNERLLVIRFYNDPLRKLYYLTQTSMWNEEDEAPDYYFIYNEKFIVLLFTGDKTFFTSTTIKSKIELSMVKYGVELSKERIDFNSPTWEIIEECDGTFLLQENRDLTMNFLPCGYKIRQDSIGRNIFFLVSPEAVSPIE